MKQLHEKHPLAIRWFHWINFPVLALMVWSGLWIYWANDVYRIGWGNTTLLRFFPQSFYEAFNVPYQLAKGMSWHFVLMWVFALNGLLYVGYTLVSGEWRELVPGRGAFTEAWQVVLHDLGVKKQLPAAGKYNAAQQLAYTAVIVMGAGSLLTGAAIYKPTQLAWLTTLLGGYAWARLEHFALTIGYVLFFVVHVVQVIKAGWNNFRSMVAGFEVVDASPTQPALPGSLVPDHDAE